MSKIIFLRTAPYNYNLINKSLYESFDEIGKQVISPNIESIESQLEDKIVLFKQKYNISKVYCSNLQRSIQTAKLFSDNYETTDTLKEVVFSMYDFSTIQDLPGKYDKQSVNKIRVRFAEALKNNQLMESSASVLARLHSFVEKLEVQNVNSSETVVCFSHGFLLRLIENYFTLPNPKTRTLIEVVSAYDWSKAPYGFLEGFVLEYANGQLYVQSSISIV